MSKRIIKKAYSLLGKEYYDARKNDSGVSYFYNELLEFPTTLRLLGNIKGKKILDLGCGPGINAGKMQSLGASVKGIDISKELIDIARVEAPNIEFLVGDASKLPYKNEEFDIIVSSLVFGHLKDWEKPLDEVRRVLRKGGFLVFSGYNPVTEKFRKNKWFFKKFRVLEGYFEEGEKRTKWSKDKSVSSEIIHYHKTFGTIIRLIISNGFEIVDYEDCKPPTIAKKKYLKHYTSCLNYPHFSVWKVRKK